MKPNKAKLDRDLCERADGQWLEGRCIGALCETCGGAGDWRRLSRSHIIPKSRGGKDTMENLLVECYPCHERYEKHPERRGDAQTFELYGD